MNQDELKRIIDSTDQYDRDKQDGLLGMIGDFYSRKMLSTVILVWAMAITFMAGAVIAAVMFFMTEQTKLQIAWAVVFMTCIQFVCSIKVFAWQMIHRNSIKRETKRLELRIVELGETIKGK